MDFQDYNIILSVVYLPKVNIDLMQSFGCQMWDAAFAIQAIISSDLAHEYGPTLRKAHDFVKASQVESLYQTSLNGLIYVVAAL